MAQRLGILAGIAWLFCIPVSVLSQIQNPGLGRTQRAGGVPAMFQLNQNYPNPFNPTTNISFEVPTDGRATLRVFNLIGQEVGVLFNGAVISGRMYKAKFDASSLPSGIYFSRLDFFPDGSSSAGVELMRKMTLLK